MWCRYKLNYCWLLLIQVTLTIDQLPTGTDRNYVCMFGDIETAAESVVKMVVQCSTPPKPHIPLVRNGYGQHLLPHAYFSLIFFFISHIVYKGNPISQAVFHRITNCTNIVCTICTSIYMGFLFFWGGGEYKLYKSHTCCANIVGPSQWYINLLMDWGTIHTSWF